jgi:hypothetical protein
MEDVRTINNVDDNNNVNMISLSSNLAPDKSVKATNNRNIATALWWRYVGTG